MIDGLKKCFVRALCFVLIVAQAGCSFFAGSTQRFTAMASEPDAQIFINGQLIGVGSVETRVKKNQSVSVMAKKEGFYPATREIDTTMSSIGILDMVGGCIFLIPFIGLAAPGAHELDQSSVTLTMQKEK